jgi:hypothetical protein
LVNKTLTTRPEMGELQLLPGVAAIESGSAFA